MPALDQARLRKIAGILAASERNAGPGAESLSDGGGGTPDDPFAILDRVCRNLAPGAAHGEQAPQPPPPAAGGNGDGDDRSPPCAAGAAGEPPDDEDAKRAEALERLFHFGKSALSKVRQGDFELDRDEGSAMEALVIADGSRPSFILRGGAFDPADPFIGQWSGPLAAARDAMRGIAGAVGRIQPAGGSASTYIGTGTLVDRAEGLVLTNFHVVVQAETVHRIAMRHEADRIVVEGALEIDFAGESGSFETRRFRIVEIRVPAGAGQVFAGIDAAVCRIEAIADENATLPAAVAPLSDNPDYATGASSSLALVGFPGPPALDGRGEVDWDWVVRTLFRNRFGVKRLAPGRFTSGLGSNPADQQAKRAICHDATTFGGASGSLVVAWADAGAPAFALHFAGETMEANYALAFARARAALEPLGVPFQPGGA